MANITAHASDRVQTFEAPEGKRLVLAIEDAGIDILHRCGGNARCTTCRVELISGDAGEIREHEAAILATKGDIPPNTRLSCQITVEGDLEVAVINQASVMGMDAGPRPTDEMAP